MLLNLLIFTLVYFAFTRTFLSSVIKHNPLTTNVFYVSGVYVKFTSLKKIIIQDVQYQEYEEAIAVLYPT